MKKLCLLLLLAVCAVFPSSAVKAAQKTGYELFGSVKFGGLTINSFSSEWDNAKLNELYAELLNNTHAYEFSFLGEINLYPDSRDNAAGMYFEDFSRRGNVFIFGRSAYIELYKANSRNTVALMAPVLAHEYGHHYTIFNMLNYEKRHYTDWGNTEYAALRFWGDKRVSYDSAAANYSYLWDITEIIADDYVQLLGSPNAKKSYDYTDAKESLDNGSGDIVQPKAFNKAPQSNPEIKLAADCTGLYEYMLEIAGLQASGGPGSARPEIEGISKEDAIVNSKYTVTWKQFDSASDTEYTLIMYPLSAPKMVTAVKTTVGTEETAAVIGTVTQANSDGTVSAILDTYAGTYAFRVYAKTADGFIYSSEPFTYDFGFGSIDAEKAIAEYRGAAGEGKIAAGREKPQALPDNTAVSVKENTAAEEKYNSASSGVYGGKTAVAKPGTAAVSNAAKFVSYSKVIAARDKAVSGAKTAGTQVIFEGKVPVIKKIEIFHVIKPEPIKRTA